MLKRRVRCTTYGSYIYVILLIIEQVRQAERGARNRLKLIGSNRCGIKSGRRYDICTRRILVVGICRPSNICCRLSREGSLQVLYRHAVSIGSEGLHEPLAGAFVMTISLAINANVSIIRGSFVQTS